MCKPMKVNDSSVGMEKKNVKGASTEEALDATGFGKYNFGLLLVCSWILQAMGMDMFGFSFVVAAAHCDLQLSMQQRALLTATPLVGVVLGAQLWGYISDTRGRKLTLMLSMGVGFICAALSSLAPDWKTMAVLKLICSTFTSASNSSAYTLLGESCPSRPRSRALLMGSCALMCSQALSAVFAYPILPLEFAYPIEFLGITYRSWRLLALVIAIPCAVNTCLLTLFYESPKFLITRGRYEEALDVLRSIYAINSGEKREKFPIKNLLLDEDYQSSKEKVSFFRALWLQTVLLFRGPLLKETLKLFYIVAVIYMTGSGFIMWLPYIMNNMFSVLESGRGEGMNLCTIINYNSDPVGTESNETSSTEICNDTIQQTTLLSAITYGAIASSCQLILSLTCGTRKRFAMMGIIAISAVAAILLNVVKVPIAGGIFFCIFLLAALSMGIISVYFVELYPTSVRGMASCLSVMLGRFCAFLGVNTIGPLIAANCEATFYGWAVLLFSTIIIAWFLPRDSAKK